MRPRAEPGSLSPGHVSITLQKEADLAPGGQDSTRPRLQRQPLRALSGGPHFSLAASKRTDAKHIKTNKKPRAPHITGAPRATAMTVTMGHRAAQR